MKSSPQSLVLCRPMLWWTKGTRAADRGAVNSVLPLVLCDRVSNPFRLSPGRESEVWQSPALSVWSSLVSLKLLQMCGESGHGAGPGWDGCLTGCRVRNLPFNNILMNSSCLFPVSLLIHNEFRQPGPGGYFQNWYYWVWMWGYLSPVLLCCVQGTRPSILSASMLSFLVSVPMPSRSREGSDEECNFFWLRFPLRRSLMTVCHTVAMKQSIGKSGKI